MGTGFSSGVSDESVLELKEGMVVQCWKCTKLKKKVHLKMFNE